MTVGEVHTPGGATLRQGAPVRTGGPPVGATLRELFDHRDRPGSRPAATVRGGEGLVGVHVHDVEPHIARPGTPDDRVEVGPVVVHERAHVVQDPGDLRDVLLEQPQRVRIGEHQACDLVIHQVPEGRGVH